MNVWLEEQAAEPATDAAVISSGVVSKLADLGLVVITQEELDDLERAGDDRRALLDGLRAVGIELMRQRVGDRIGWTWDICPPLHPSRHQTNPHAASALRLITASAIRDYAQRARTEDGGLRTSQD